MSPKVLIPILRIRIRYSCHLTMPIYGIELEHRRTYAKRSDIQPVYERRGGSIHSALGTRLPKAYRGSAFSECLARGFVHGLRYVAPARSGRNESGPIF
jgi:hypothetical protein